VPTTSIQSKQIVGTALPRLCPPYSTGELRENAPLPPPPNRRNISAW